MTRLNRLAAPGRERFEPIFHRALDAAGNFQLEQLMKYMLLIYGAESCWTEDERRDCMIESMGICDELAAEGKYIASAPLHSVATATSLRIRGGKRQITDGPFAETTEQLGGYYIIEVDNLDEAIAVAGRLPPAKMGTVEIRPLFPLPDRTGSANVGKENSERCRNPESPAG